MDQTDLTSDELAALQHWSMHGQPGEPRAATFVPDADLLAKLQGFVAPVEAPIELRFDVEQTATLLRGFEAEVMEDKWMIVAAVADDSATASVDFYRSWTHNLTIRLEIALTPEGAEATKITYESDPERVKLGGDAAYWRDQVVEVCRWVLGMASLAG